MLFGKPLFSNIQNNENFNNIINANFTIPETISPKARSFLYCMLQKDGINRLSCTQLLNHEFIKENFFIDQTSDYDKIPIINKNYNQNITNIIFNDVKGKKINIPVDENTKIQDVIRLYFHRIKRPELTHNYHNKFSFLFNGKNLRYSLNNTVKNMKIMSYCTIQVYKI